MTAKETDQRDHVDQWLEAAWLEDIPNFDAEVEGIVDRMNGLNRRIRRSLNAVIAEHGLTYEEWDVLGALRQAGPPFRRSAGSLSKRTDLSSGAMTNRLDRLEKAGLVRRLPDPDDRRGVLIELTDEGEKKWVATAEVQAAYENLIKAALNKRETEQLNSLLRRLMIEFERSEDGDAKKP
jgi:DNA-binding MarR family transcriptional regulator